ncbi:MAG: hypothetical protein HOO96_41175 [Polyangiaceae bacterium]|nr:hypothetical protein [Polyangiaceae bacterium]
MTSRLFLFLGLSLVVGFAPYPPPSARVSTGVAPSMLAGDLESPVVRIGGTWGSLSLRKGETKAPMLVFNVTVSDAEHLDYRDVELHVRGQEREQRRELSVRASSGAPAVGSTMNGGGTAWFDFTVDNAQLANLEEAWVVFRGETYRVRMDQLRPR